VDGAYRIRLAEHQWSRHTGYITWLEVNSWIGGSPANDFSAFPPAEQVGDFVPVAGPSIG
jgi:hypothetical protein